MRVFVCARVCDVCVCVVWHVRACGPVCAMYARAGCVMDTEAPVDHGLREFARASMCVCARALVRM